MQQLKLGMECSQEVLLGAGERGSQHCNSGRELKEKPPDLATDCKHH